ncbi:NAD(P)/FAD-dependent oxidoreductase [Rhizorhabdus sp.]|uniref:phytoene desaturase family protein n=1 Tax=Rhizorhabdus sp. TaxID=1968843 RepID=UPI0019A813CA|nr:NAD(P)/FAD-dependent oxidoreductase [Rhizorhabdus sp.]MBD3759344.1 NAD(P)/FAD-dependent oxidoreductase [Rhizorhabdus sp.]
MSDKYDVLAIGSGHNGLIAAAYLARAGKRVLVLERNPHLGGGCVTSEIAAPGFFHDWHSALHVLIQANPLIRDDELGLISQFGLEYIYPEGMYSTVFDDGDSLVTYRDLEKTCEAIARISPKDADAYRAFVAQSSAVLPLMLQGLFVPPAPQGAFWALLDQSTDGRALMHIMQKSMLDIVNDHFEHDKVKIHLMKCAAELLIEPDEKGTGAFIFNMAGFVHSFPWGIPKGGSRALVDALVRCLEAEGADIRADSPVEQVLVRDGKVHGVRLDGGEVIPADIVIGQIHPWLLGAMVEDLDEGVAGRARNTKTSPYSLMSAFYAMAEVPQFDAPKEASYVAAMNFAPASLEAYLRVFDDLRYGDLPKSLTLGITNLAQFDPARAPDGGATLAVHAFAPCELRGGADWDARKDDMRRHMDAVTAGICANFNADTLVGADFATPRDSTRHTPTFQAGDVGGIGKAFFQMGGHRPTPELSQYAVPGAEGLYLAGAFMHPPGGVTGGGRATAIRICDDLAIDFAAISENR